MLQHIIVEKRVPHATPHHSAHAYKVRAALARAVAAFFKQQAPLIANQIADLRSQFRKAELSQDEIDALDAIVAGINFTGWSVLVGNIESLIEALVVDGAYAALAQVGIDVEAASGPDGIVNAYAQQYARERSAELVGMRRDELGNLVSNPNAQWAIDEPTRSFLRTSVASAIDEGWSNDKLAGAITDNYAFSNSRAVMIARTETQMATNSGALAGYKASNVVEAKQWVTADDDKVDEECVANSEAGASGDGVLGLNDDYPSGDDAPPAHPNCRCVLVPVVSFDSESGQ